MKPLKGERPLRGKKKLRKRARAERKRNRIVNHSGLKM